MSHLVHKPHPPPYMDLLRPLRRSQTQSKFRSLQLAVLSRQIRSLKRSGERDYSC
jgi:hypothetical protein